MPLETINAFLDHGQVERTLDHGLDQARDDLRAVEAEGISMERVTAELVEEGVASFSTSFEELLAAIDGQREALARV
jgi:transaldolase